MHAEDNVCAQGWAVAGIGVYGVLTLLNCFWLYKLIQLAMALSPAPTVKTDAKQPVCSAAAAVELTAASGEAAVTVPSSSCRSDSSKAKTS